MKLQEGKYYEGVDGNKYGPMRCKKGELNHPWEEAKDGSCHIWREDGTSNWYEDPNLVAEWGSSNTGFKIPWEAADSITLGCLQDHYKMAKSSLDEWYEGKGWLHRDDVERQSVLMFHLRAVIEYYGGSVE